MSAVSCPCSEQRGPALNYNFLFSFSWLAPSSAVTESARSRSVSPSSIQAPASVTLRVSPTAEHGPGDFEVSTEANPPTFEIRGLGVQMRPRAYIFLFSSLCSRRLKCFFLFGPPWAQSPSSCLVFLGTGC